MASLSTDLQIKAVSFLLSKKARREDGLTVGYVTDTKPFKYNLVENEPVVYSVGRNRADDGGVASERSADGFESDLGDWTLWPIAAGGQ